MIENGPVNPKGDVAKIFKELIADGGCIRRLDLRSKEHLRRPMMLDGVYVAGMETTANSKFWPATGLQSISLHLAFTKDLALVNISLLCCPLQDHRQYEDSNIRRCQYADPDDCPVRQQIRSATTQ